MMDDIDRTFTWWQNALKGERGPISADDPMSGFYRWVWKKPTGTTMGVVAYWYDSHDQLLRCQVDGRDIDDIKARTRWPHDSRRPISEEVFQAFRDTGKFPDVDDAAQSDPEIADAAPELTAAKTLAALKASAKKYAKVESDEEMAKGQSLRARLQELASSAKKLHKAEKEPHLEACRVVDAKWLPMAKDAEATAVAIRTALEGWNDFKLEQAEKARKAADAGAQPGQASPTPVASNAPPPSVQIAGGGGRAAHVGAKSVVTAIDLEKAWQQFGGLPEVYNMFMELAQLSVNAGVDTPCATVEKKSAIR